MALGWSGVRSHGREAGGRVCLDCSLSCHWLTLRTEHQSRKELATRQRGRWVRERERQGRLTTGAAWAICFLRAAALLVCVWMEDAPGPAHESVFICFFVNLYIVIPTPPKTCIHCSCVFLTLAISKSPVIILALSVCCLFLWFVCVCVFVSFCLVFYLAVPSLSCGIRDLSCGMGTLSCGMWDLVSCPGIKPGPPVLGEGSLTCRTTKEVPFL